MSCDPVKQSSASSEACSPDLRKLCPVRLCHLPTVHFSAHGNCGHEIPLPDAQTSACLLCDFLAAERNIISLKAELDTTHDRLVTLESELLAERESQRTTRAELGRAQQQIVRRGP